MEPNKKKYQWPAFCLGILLVGVLIQAAGWLKGDRLVFPDVGEILQAVFRLPDLPQEDSADALAIAMTHLHQRRLAGLRAR